MTEEKKKALILNENGVVTTDFIFSFFLAFMFMAFLFAMCFSFTVIEIGQYISYSAVRAAIPSHKNFDAQRTRAETKANSLIANPILSPFFRNGWFELSVLDMRLGQDSNDLYSSEYQDAEFSSGGGANWRIPAAGVRLNLKAKVLELNLGPLGRIESATGNGFNLTLVSLLFREPNQRECQALMQRRYEQIIGKSSLYGPIASPTAGQAVPMEDTGC